MKILPLAEAKAKLSQLVAEVSQTDEEISITRNGRAAAVLVSHDEFESWKETAAVLSDPEFREQIRKGMKALRTRRAKTFRGGDLDRLFSGPR
jgi:antitoxin YefM